MQYPSYHAMAVSSIPESHLHENIILSVHAVLNLGYLICHELERASLEMIDLESVSGEESFVSPKIT